jgi:hypothetical protein
LPRILVYLKILLFLKQKWDFLSREKWSFPDDFSIIHGADAGSEVKPPSQERAPRQGFIFIPSSCRRGRLGVRFYYLEIRTSDN